MSSDQTSSDGQANIGSLLRTYRDQAGYTQEELAELAGVTGGLIANVETGRRNLGTETAARVADALRLTVEDRARLVGARDRYAASTAAASRKLGAAPWDEMLERQRQVSDALEEMRDLLAEIAAALRPQQSP